jgi:hypothetical protein
MLNHAVIGSMNQVLMWNILSDRKQLMSGQDSRLLLQFWEECILSKPVKGGA